MAETPTVQIPAFPADVVAADVEVTTATSTSSIPVEEGRHRRWLQKITSAFLLFALAGLSIATVLLVYDNAVRGSADAQKLAYGLIGTVLGILWTNYGKLVDLVSKR